MQKFIVVTGGVLSGLGKGVTTASIGRILMSRSFSVMPIKIDGYVNVDAGTMNPFEHGEVYVTDDGGEIDLDIGHYERFLDTNLGKKNNLTTGLVYKTVIEKERKGDYLGKTVQVIPHITNEIKKRIEHVAKKSKADFVLIEVGGTVGDIENMVFIEALRQLHLKHQKDFLFIHLTLVPTILSGEQKTKPTQHSVKELLSIGIQPNIIMCRCSKDLPKKQKEKIALFCSVPDECVISNPDLDSIYDVPLKLEEQDLSSIILKHLRIKNNIKPLKEWAKFVDRMHDAKKEVTIGIAGKYTDLHDSYLSIVESLCHAGTANGAMVQTRWIDTEKIEEEGPHEELAGIDGLIVPGGFGSRGGEGKITAIKYVRENNIPFLGICYGMQLAVAEFARNVCGLKGANSTEINEKTKYPVIDYLKGQKDIDKLGGTMRLGAYDCNIKKGTLAYKLYESTKISERHRHRWEVNNKFRKIIEKGGMVFSGINPQQNLVEMMELPDHKYFIGTQAHPEFKSRPMNPAPLFDWLVKAALEK